MFCADHSQSNSFRGSVGKVLKASSPDKEEDITDDYELLHVLGQGSFSKVKLALHRPTNICVAVKMKEGNDCAIDNEILIMTTLDHPNIVRLYQVVERGGVTYMVMENASGGTLWTRIITSGRLSEEEAQGLFPQLVLAVEHCHSKGFAHRDIKPTNILLDSKGNIKLCDFGLAIKTQPGKTLTGFCGTTIYCAPEMFDNKGYDAQKQDIWSLGLVLYFLVTATLPFEGVARANMRKKILSSSVTLPPGLSNDMTNIVKKLLTINPRLRPVIGEIKKHAWLKLCGDPDLPPCTDRTLDSTQHRISMLMCLMGFKMHDLREALNNRVYNRVMATYLILKHETPWGDSSYHKTDLRIPSGVAMTLERAPTFSHSSQKSSSEPALSAFSKPTKPYGQKTNENRRLSCPYFPTLLHHPVPVKRGSSGATNWGLWGRTSQSTDRSVSSNVPSAFVISHGSASATTISSFLDLSSLSYRSPANPESSNPHRALTSQEHESEETSDSMTTTQTSSSSDNKPRTKTTSGESLEEEASNNTKRYQGPSRQTASTACIQTIYSGCRRLGRRLSNCFRYLCCCGHNTGGNQEAPINGERTGATGSQGRGSVVLDNRVGVGLHSSQSLESQSGLCPGSSLSTQLAMRPLSTQEKTGKNTALKKVALPERKDHISTQT